jgi:hypothetical protein
MKKKETEIKTTMKMQKPQKCVLFLAIFVLQD